MKHFQIRYVVMCCIGDNPDDPRSWVEYSHRRHFTREDAAKEMQEARTRNDLVGCNFVVTEVMAENEFMD